MQFFRTFLLHALTYWAQILHKTFFHRIKNEVRVSSIYMNSCGSYAPFGTSNTGNTQFSALFSYMLWHIELKVCIWLCFTVLQIMFECCEFVSIVVGVMPLLELRILKIHSFSHFSLYWKYNVQFSALFSYMLWHIELKFCIRLCFTVLQIKFECLQFASILVGVMSLLELQILEIHSFLHFSLTCFDILSWKFAYDFVSPYYKSSSSVVNLLQLV